MGKSGKLFKSLAAGVKVFKSPSKERHAKDNGDHAKKRSKDKCFGSLGKSASRNREAIPAAPTSPEAIEIKCVQVESEKLKEASPGPPGESFGVDCPAENNLPVKTEGGTVGYGFPQRPQPCSKDEVIISVSDHHQELAALKIQAAFRCYLAQRAFRALKAVVRLQALARGRLVRRQAAISLRCVNALIRIQALARGRRVRKSELGQLVQKHLQQARHSRRKSNDGWVHSMTSAQQSHGKVHAKHDAVTKRQRALVSTYSEQLNSRSSKETSSLGIDDEIKKSHWIWEWLQRWTGASLKRSSAAVRSVEQCVPVVNNLDKAITGTNGGKHSNDSQKEGRERCERAESNLPLSERGLAFGDYEEAGAFVKNDDVLTEKVGTTTLLEQKTGLQPPPNPPPPSPSNERTVVGVETLSLPNVQQSTSKLSSDDPTLSQCVADAIQPFSPGYESSLVAENGTNYQSGSEVLRSQDNKPTTGPVATSYISPSSSTVAAANGHSANASAELFELQSEPPSALSFLPKELCRTSELSSMNGSKEANMSSMKVDCGLMNKELLQDDPLSIVPESEEMKQATSWGTEMSNPYNDGNGENRDNVKILTDNSDDTQEPAMIQVKAKDDDSTSQGNALAQTNGGCDAAMVSTEVSSRSPNGVDSKHEQMEYISPSLPGYMATTMSSKAKIRSHTSPKQKADVMKQKLESPKPKSDSPTAKGDSPSQRPDSASKRRHSLSALDGKVSTVAQNQRPAYHKRANSRGNFPSMKDLSTDNVSLPNGDSRRHGK